MNVFKDSFKKLIEPNDQGFVATGFNTQLTMHCSKDVKVGGAVGACTSLQRKGPNVSESEVGEGATNGWSLGSVDVNTTLAFYLEVTNEQMDPQAIAQGRQPYLQFCTTYHHASGNKRLRVTTVGFRYAEPGRVSDLASGFDQECAAVLMARFAIFKTEREDRLDVLRWVDRMLIRLVAKFADYAKDDPKTFHLSPEFSLFPQFMYHLRRSGFLQTFNASPDETAYHRVVINRDTVSNSLVMIQPVLTEYSMEAAPHPVRLDSTSLKSNIILVMDTFFYVVVWRGEQVQAWFDAGTMRTPSTPHSNTVTRRARRRREVNHRREDASAEVRKHRMAAARRVSCFPR